jgi:tetratricopeptide (TPR) repeat protein
MSFARSFDNMTTRSSSSPTAGWRWSLLWLTTAGQGSHARELRNRVRMRIRQLDNTYDIQIVDETIILAHEAYELSSESVADRIDACMLLAESLRRRLNRHEDDSLLEEMITLGREALTLSPKHHPKRAQSCRGLALSLEKRYQRTGDMGLLDEAIDLERETLDLRPAGHPDRPTSCGNLANSLAIRYDHMGDIGLLNEAIDLEREALDLYPPEHPGRSWSYGSLASSLKKRYQCTGDVSLLDEAIYLQRKGLDLRPLGHPDRSSSCGNLANSLATRYQRTGHVSLLDEAIHLQREALDLRPTGHPDRSTSCGNLANSLLIRYERTGDAGTLVEAIDLQRQALDLCLPGHLDRSSSCGNLAISLLSHYESTSDVHALYEAIDLQRESLDLRPVGHPERSVSCGNLAVLLSVRFKRIGDDSLLDEVIGLHREALALRPTGHPHRYVSCGSLASSLSTLHKRTGDVALLHESLTLSKEAVTIAPMHAIWSDLHHLTRAHLQSTSPSYDVNKAIFYLSQSLEHDPDDTLVFVISLSFLLDDLWECYLEGKQVQLTTIYQRLVNLLPLLAHPALGLQPQLQALKRSTRLGSDAFVNAILAENCSVGLETLELAQGVIWSQSLHRRYPQLKDVPEHLASKLQNLLRSFVMSSTTQPYYTEPKWLTPQDVLHAQSSRAYSVIREIRALPGLSRFMLGETWETLRTAASDHPVVVLVGARGHYCALILAASLSNGHEVLSLDLIDEDLKNLSFTPGSSRARQSAVAIAKETLAEGDRAGFKKTERAPSKPLDGQLKTLWHKVVKPVLAHLDLEVS